MVKLAKEKFVVRVNVVCTAWCTVFSRRQLKAREGDWRVRVDVVVTAWSSSPMPAELDLQDWFLSTVCRLRQQAQSVCS